MNDSRSSSDEEHELAKYLSGRLTQHLTGNFVESKVWEVEISSLRQVQRLGSGSVGTVCKSTWFGVEVAEKIFYGTDHPSFRNEVDILAGLVHPNIVPLLGYAMDESRCSIVMELMDGDLLFLMRERLRQNPGSRFPFTTSEAVAMMLQTAEGMRYIHANRVVHRDLKSQNILVKSRKGIDAEYIYAKVGDFGLSKTKEHSSSYSNLSSNTGTTRWMAPELIPGEEHDPQAKTELTYPFKVDVFSFGMVCYEILTGKVPFSTISSAREIKRMVLDGIRPELPDECLPDLKILIHACWESDPRKRPTFVEICKRLRGVKYLLLRVETPQRYLEVARKCTHNATRILTSASASTAVQFNQGQCTHLARKVAMAVQSAEARSLLLYSPEVMASSVEITKLLCRCAKEVEVVIESCRHDNWVQAAVVLWNASEYVSSLSSDLDFCMILLKNLFVKVTTWQELAPELAEVEVLDKSESVSEIVRSDQRALLWRLETMNESQTSSDEEQELAKYLSGRLTQHLTGVVDSRLWEFKFSRLRHVQRLGRGSVGTVCISTWLGVEVAGEIFDETDYPSFRNEVDILARWVHPNIVPLLGYAMDESRCSIVMELMDGDLLFLIEERLRQNPGSRFPFTTSEAVDLMLQTAEGMRYIHANRVVHMGLKSRNILVKSRNDSDGEYIYVKLASCALLERKEQSSSCELLTSDTGASRWMAPELISQGVHDPQARTELRHPFKVDVFSFGMVCYEILTGKVPFSTISSAGEIMKMVLNGIRPELPDECLPDLKVLINACWESDARNRPSFVEICKRLRCVKYLLMRGSGITSDAHHVVYKADACWEEQGAHPLLFTSWAVRVLPYDFSGMERIHGSRSMFRAIVGGRVVAVKDLQGILPATSNPPEFLKMVLPHFKLAHENVLTMREFRLEEKLKVAVFEYAPLGSLRSILHGEGKGSVHGPSTPVFTWRQRVKIAVGVARGLEYLHEQYPPVICGSIRSSNILMFEDDVAKIGHFALLQSPSPIDSFRNTLLPGDRAPWAPWVLFCEPARAPELYETGEASSQKIDIYDFGVVLVELLTGKRIHNIKELNSIKHKLRDYNELPNIVDPRMSSSYPTESAAKTLAACAALSIQYEADFRPSARILVQALQPLLWS